MNLQRVYHLHDKAKQEENVSYVEVISKKLIRSKSPRRMTRTKNGC